ncbi:MAG: hypothetical protein WD989_00175 [Candidatus Paceibacterota bacterium]
METTTPNIGEFDHIVFDSRGIRGVKDGKEYSISEEEYRTMRPEHRNVGCGKCSFVQDKGTLFAFFVDRKEKAIANEKPKFVGFFTLPNWVGHSGFYLFKCPDCGNLCIDYPHGYHENGCLYVRCERCDFTTTFYPDKYGDVYERENIVAPSSVWQEIKHLLKIGFPEK